MEFNIYTIENCPYCDKALNFLIINDLNYKEILIPYDDKKKIKKKNNMNTFPQIFLNSEKIGGYSDLVKIFRITDVIIKSNLSIGLIENIYNEINKNTDEDKAVSISFS